MPFKTAISGLQAAQVDLNVIGNNVANSNTTGFKRSRAEFRDVYAVSNVGASSNDAGRRIASPEMLPCRQVLPHLKCSPRRTLGDHFNEESEHDGTRRTR